MTENEAKIFIQNAMEQSRNALAKLMLIMPKVFAVRKKSLGEYYSNLENCKKEIEACEIAVKALEDIQQYRAIGTPHELRTMKEHGGFTGVELAQIEAGLMKLKEYENLEKQGRLVKLPCKKGDTVYKVDRVSNKIKQHKVIKFEVGQVDFDDYSYCFLHHFGKTVFLTREEAEAKLKELRGGEAKSI